MAYRYSYEELWKPKNFLLVFRMYQINLGGNETREYEGSKKRWPNHFVEHI